MTANVDSCSCDLHGESDKPNLPWLPKKVRFNVSGFDGQAKANARKIPSLLPLTLASPSSFDVQGPSSTQSVAPGSSSIQIGNIVIPEPSSSQNVASGPSSANQNDTIGQNATRDSFNNDGDAEAIQTQIRINTQMMAEVEKMRKEMDKVNKERDFFKIKFSKAKDQLEYLKKKFAKKNEQDENIDPNVDTGENFNEVNGTPGLSGNNNEFNNQ